MINTNDCCCLLHSSVEYCKLIRTICIGYHSNFLPSSFFIYLRLKPKLMALTKFQTLVKLFYLPTHSPQIANSTRTIHQAKNWNDIVSASTYLHRLESQIENACHRAKSINFLVFSNSHNRYCAKMVHPLLIILSIKMKRFTYCSVN